MRRFQIILVLVMISVAIGLGTYNLVAKGQTRLLVYVCQQQPCTNTQEFEVFDSNGAPIFSVGEFGGAGVFGDNFKIFPPSSVFNAALTESYHAPSGACVPPSVWLSPQGLWKCAAGQWRLVLNLR